jgi:hypothetical protein
VTSIILSRTTGRFTADEACFKVGKPDVIGPLVRADHPMPAAHTAPPAMSVIPAMKSTVSAGVRIQL